MAQYIVSARKYRPDSFGSLLGQDTIVRTLKNSVIRGQLAHAYLFCGPRGVGKTSAARIFAKMINCANPSADMEPCGQCESCRSFAEGRSYCIHELDAASNNSVDDIKALIDQVNVPPQVGRYSVYIVDEVHMLSQQAFNAFLKTLEEPPAHAIFILATTEKHKILPTILSRCQTYDFNRISVGDMVVNLRKIADAEGIKIEDESLHLIAMKADGAMRDALTIFDQTVAFCGTDIKYADVMSNLGVLDYDHCFNLVDAFLAGDYTTALLTFDSVLSKGFNALHFISALSSHLRDLIVAGNGGLAALLDLPESLKQRYREQASRCPLQFLYEALGIAVQCESGYKTSVNPRLHIEFALMRLSMILGKLPAGQSAPQATRVEAAEPAEAASQTEQAGPGPAPAEPAPAVSRRRTARKSAGLSLASITGEDNNASSKAAEARESEDSVPDASDVENVWAEIAAGYSSRPRLANALATSKRTYATSDEGTLDVTFSVVNEGQKDWIRQQILTDLEKRLREKVGSSRLRLLIDVLPDEKVADKPYMPKEQALELISRNPEIKAFVTEFKLDTK